MRREKLTPSVTDRLTFNDYQDMPVSDIPHVLSEIRLYRKALRKAQDIWERNRMYTKKYRNSKSVRA